MKNVNEVKQLLLLTLLIFCSFLSSKNVIAQVPGIDSFTPTSGPIGTQVTITGTNFDSTPANNIVYFGATQAVVSAASSTELTVTVPTSATYSPISVLVNGLIAYSQSPFIVTFDGSTMYTDTFEPKKNFDTGTNPLLTSIGDLDGDGKTDLIVTNNRGNSISLFRNTSTVGSINYENHVEIETGSDPTSVSIGDLDGDGKVDLAVTNQGDDNVSIFRNTSSGSGNISFATKENFSTGSNPRSIAMNDLDEDGKTDLVITNYASNTVSILRNISSGAGVLDFAAKIDFSTGEKPRSVAIGDLNNDGKPDLAVANYNTLDFVSVFRNTSSGPGTISFAPKQNFDAGEYPISIAIGDVDGDGLSDLAVANNNGHSVSILLNQDAGESTINFAHKVDYDVGTTNYSVAMGDLNGDGKIDLAAACISCNTIAIFENSISEFGTVNFENRIDLKTDEDPYSVAIGDLDGDGRPDIISTNQGGYSISTFKNIIPELSFKADITSFSIPIQFDDAMIDSENKTIKLEVPYGTDRTNLIATFSLSNGAVAKIGEVIQVNNVTENDLSNPVFYSITAEDGQTKVDWTITVTELPNTETEILSYAFDEQTKEATIDVDNHIITLEVPYGTNIFELIGHFSLSPGATAKVFIHDQISGTTANNFSLPVTYTIIAEDGVSSQEWLVNVNKALNTETQFLSYSIIGETRTASIDQSTHSIDIEVSNESDITNLVASFELSEGAHAWVGTVQQESGSTSNDFSLSVTYKVIAENDLFATNWIVHLKKILEVPREVQNFVGSPYPNPSKGWFVLPVNLADDYDQVDIALRDLTGKVVLFKSYTRQTKGKQKFLIDLSTEAGKMLSPGTYVIELNMVDESRFSFLRKKMFIQNQ